MQLGLGGTANLAVLGGNLPPSSGAENSATEWLAKPLVLRWAGSPPQRAGGPFHPDPNASFRLSSAVA